MAVCPQRLCQSHSSLASQPSALSIIWTAYRPRCAACSDLPIAFQPGLTAKHAFCPSARSPPALRGASACLNYSNRDALSGWPHLHDCFQITLRSAMELLSTNDLTRCSYIIYVACLPPVPRSYDRCMLLLEHGAGNMHLPVVAKQLLVAASMPLTYTVLAVYCFGSLLLWQPTAMFGSTALAVRQPIGIAVMVMLCV